jgi:hypothetical protein
MVGFSIEKGNFCAAPVYTGTNTNMINCFKRLGNGILRIGGNTVDFGIWDPADVSEGANYGVLPASIDGLAAFLKATGWQVIYGVDMDRSTPALAAAEAAYAAKALGSSLLAIEIGNEPEMYGSPNFPTPFTFAEFNAAWTKFAAAIRAAVPGVPLSGAAVPGDEPLITGWTIPFANAQGKTIQILTEHHYENNPATPAALLTPNANLPFDVQRLVAAANANGISGGFRIAETNSHAGGGLAGVSDTYASALWSIDYVMRAAQNGCAGLNFHGGAHFIYTAISDLKGVVDGIHPLYYGLMLVTLAGTGNFVPVALNTSVPLNVTAYAIRRSDGTTALIINNKETTTALAAEVTLSAAVSYVIPTSVTSPGGLAATSGVTIGGAPVGLDGSWPHPVADPFAFGITFPANVPPLTATLYICG